MRTIYTYLILLAALLVSCGSSGPTESELAYQEPGIGVCPDNVQVQVEYTDPGLDFALEAYADGVLTDFEILVLQDLSAYNQR